MSSLCNVSSWIRHNSTRIWQSSWSRGLRS